TLLCAPPSQGSCRCLERRGLGHHWVFWKPNDLTSYRLLAWLSPSPPSFPQGGVRHEVRATEFAPTQGHVDEVTVIGYPSQNGPLSNRQANSRALPRWRASTDRRCPARRGSPRGPHPRRS